MFKTLNECIHYIENQIPQKIDLSLTRVQAAAQLLDNPQNKYRTIHITGTNGKGSTSAFITQLLSSQGLKVGLFTSPHLISYNERIRIGDQVISNQAFIGIIEQIINQVLPNIQLTVFECLTLVGYQYFANQAVDVAVIEVGLGGKYDATNIIHPSVACVTNVSIDHVHFLSNDIVKIAEEKAGIFKKESINLHTVDDFSLHSILQQDKCKEMYVKPYISYEAKQNGFLIEFEMQALKYRGLFPMFGIHQIRNLEAALAVVFAYLNLVNAPIKEELLYEQIQMLTWKGRMELLAPHVFFDGAHNIAGIQALVNTVELHFAQRKVGVVFSVMKDKDYDTMLQLLRQCSCISHIYFLPLAVNRALRSLPKQFISDSKISEINEEYIGQIIQQHQLIVFAGSLYGYEMVCELIKKEGDS